MTLTDFLLQRIAEDESAAQAATVGPWRESQANPGDRVTVWSETAGEHVHDEMDPLDRAQSDADSRHIARWEPARVLAECEAKRQIISYCDTMTHLDRSREHIRTGDAWVMLRALSLPYADRADFDSAWRV